jgi:hypothetical protein
MTMHATPKHTALCQLCERTIPVINGHLAPHGTLGQPPCTGYFECENDNHDIQHEHDPDSMLGDSYYCTRCDWAQVG